MTSPLFNRFNRLVQEQAREAFRQTPLGQAVGILRNAKSRGVVSRSTYNRLRGTLRNSGRPDAVMDALGGAGFGDAIRQVERYAKGGFWNSFLNALGPMGQLVGALLNPSGKSTGQTDIAAEIDAAKRFLEAMGYEVRKRQKAQGAAGPKAQRTSGKDPLTEIIEDQGFSTEPPPTQEPPRTAPGKSGKVRIPGLPGDLKPNDPIVTGEMIEVTSSNVHSIGYILDRNNPQKGTLKIRFWQKLRGQKDRKPGPLYYYNMVPVWVFQAFTKAASKGRFVWDNVRIRGTVAGHRYRYSLAGISQGYVPRRATVVGQTIADADEFFIPRQVKINGRVRESVLPAQRVGRYEPNRGTGGINRGTPNRGR